MRKKGTRKCRCRCKVTQKARIKKKSEQASDTIPKAPAKVYPENGTHFKVKIRRK